MPLPRWGYGIFDVNRGSYFAPPSTRTLSYELTGPLKLTCMYCCILQVIFKYRPENLAGQRRAKCFGFISDSDPETVLKFFRNAEVIEVLGVKQE